MLSSRRRALILVAFVTIPALGESAAGQNPPNVPAQPPASVCPVAGDDQYAYSKEQPVQVGGSPAYGAARQRRYLEALRGPKGQRVAFKLGGTVTGPDGTLLDSYQLTYDGMKQPVTIYMDWYHYNPQLAPRGFLCGQPLNLGIPPLDPFQEMRDLEATAIAEGSTRDFDPIPLDEGAVHGILFDRFRLLARAARAAAAEGHKLDPHHLPRDIGQAGTVVVAYPLTCRGQPVQVVSIDFVAPNGAIMPRTNLPPPTADVGGLVRGLKAPEGSLALGVSMVRPRSNDSVKLTYAEPCGEAGNAVMLPLRFTQARPIETPMPPLPAGATADRPMLLQGLIDPDGAIQQITYLGGPKDLAPAATEAVSRWRSEPARINGAPVAVGALLQVRFTPGPSK